MKELNVGVTAIGSNGGFKLASMLRKSKYVKQIIGFDCNYPECKHTWSIDKGYEIPRVDEKSYVKKIKEIYEKEKIDILFVPNDNEIGMLTFQRGIKIVPTYPEVATLLWDKYFIYKYLDNIGFDVARTELEWFEGSLRKPYRSSGGVGIVETDISASMSFFQEKIIGREFIVEVMSYIQDGKYKFAYVVPREIYERKAGTTVCGRFIKNEELIKICKKIVELFGLYGHCHIQFIKGGDKYYYLETNYRYSASGYFLNEVAGVDFINDWLEIEFFKYDPKEDPYEKYMNQVPWGQMFVGYYTGKLEGEML